jgi:ABC-2 type transport system ATP-binding protein
MSADNSIVVDGLVREFKKGPRAVDGIDLRVEPGEIYGFLGPNGAGKSTTVLMLTTLLPPTAGTARVAGFDVVREGLRSTRSSPAATTSVSRPCSRDWRSPSGRAARKSSSSGSG